MNSIADAALIAEAQALLSQALEIDAPMRSYTTWKIGGPADMLAQPASMEELAALLRWATRRDLPWMVLGNGSNLLVGDLGIRGLVIRMGEALSQSQWRGREVTAGAGKLMAALALEAAERGCAGLEFARGIPGSVGGAVRMNAGAYEHNVGEYVTEVTGVAYDGEIMRVAGEDISFAYRESSLFELPAVVASVSLRLLPGEREQIMAEMKDFQQRRSLAQPLEFPSCGSVFRNPPNDHAGHLVEMAGLRGLRVGDAQVSEKHGNFIINRGRATAAEVQELISQVQESVYQYAGVHLQPEVKLVGEFV